MKVLVSGAVCYFKQLMEMNGDIQFNFWKSLSLLQLKSLKVNLVCSVWNPRLGCWESGGARGEGRSTM